MDDKGFLKDIVWRNLCEITAAEDYLKILFEWGHAKVIYSERTDEPFLVFADMALQNDALSKLMKVLDKNDQSGSFWYIYNHFSNIIEPILGEYSLTKEEIEGFYKERLKVIRDKTHMHIDLKGSVNRTELYSNANIKWDEIKIIVGAVRSALQQVWDKNYDDNRGIRRYGGDLMAVFKAAEAAGLLRFSKNR